MPEEIDATQTTHELSLGDERRNDPGVLVGAVLVVLLIPAVVQGRGAAPSVHNLVNDVGRGNRGVVGGMDESVYDSNEGVIPRLVYAGAISASTRIIDCGMRSIFRML